MDKGNSDTSSSESGELDMYQILIVDDEERVRDLLAKNISKLPLEVEVAAVASDGREALELAIQLKPDIVITDIAMPFLNGLELIRKMRENGIESKNLIISGYDEFDYARQAIALGVQNYLLKPFLPKDIKNELEKIIRELDSQRVLLQNMEMLENLAQSRNAIMQETVLKDILEGSQEKMDLWKDSGIKTDASWYVAGILKLEQSKWDFANQNKVEEFLEMIQKNKRPFDLLMSYYQCAVMEIETKFRVLNQEYSLEYDKNPIEGIKTRIKSYDSIVRKIRRKNIPMSLTAIEENIKDIAGVRVICSFPEDIYELADSFLRQDDIVLIEKKDYIKNPKPSGYRSLHLIVQVPIFLQKNKKMVNVEVQFRTIAMDFWASLEHKLRYKKDIPADQAQQLQEELLACATQSAQLDNRMQEIRNQLVSRADKGNQS